MNSDDSEASNDHNRKRVTAKPTKCPNPLFEQWLEEWRTEAANRNSDLQYCFGKALQSLRRYPVVLNSGRECLVLKNFGNQLAVKLDRKLAEYRRTHPDIVMTNDTPVPRSEPVAISSHAQSDSGPVPSEVLKPKRKRKQKTQLPNGVNDAKIPSSKNTKPYSPEVHSGAYAILITMLKEKEDPFYPGHMLKVDIMRKAQHLSDSSFTRPDPGSRYTAWNSMSTLTKKLLVTKSGCPAKYTLTNEGEELARKLLQKPDVQINSTPNSTDSTPISSPYKNGISWSPAAYQNESPIHLNNSGSPSSPNKFSVPSSSCVSPMIYSSQNSRVTSPSNVGENFQLEYDDICMVDDVPEPVSCTSETNSPCENDIDSQNSNGDSNTFEQLFFLPNDYKIILLVDTQETIGRTKTKLMQETIRELTDLKVNFEVRHLKVGDFVWIARNSENKELLLPYIIERKRMDDLGKSIKDGRFHEQKFRLRQCGLQNVIYLIEKFGNEARLGLPMTTLQQAIINTQVVDNFFVKTTNSHRHSMFYLSMLTQLLTNMFKDKTLFSCARNNLQPFDVSADLISLQTFQEFSKLSMKNKNMKIQDVFMKHLLQLKGVSVEKATVIVQKYPTVRLLKEAFNSSNNPENLLANLTFGPLKRNIGPTVSKAIYQLYTKRILS